MKDIFAASTHDVILFFTNLGKCHRKKGYQIPEAGRTARGTAMINVLPLEAGEYVTAGVTLREFSEDEYLMMVTQNGTVKRVQLSELNTARKAGIKAITLDEDDSLISVKRTDGDRKILLATRDGMAICFHESDVRCMGRTAYGVRGITLGEDDRIVGAGIYEEGKEIKDATKDDVCLLGQIKTVQDETDETVQHQEKIRNGPKPIPLHLRAFGKEAAQTKKRRKRIDEVGHSDCQIPTRSHDPIVASKKAGLMFIHVRP